MKKKSSQKLLPTFEVRLIGPGLEPAMVPLRTVSEALAAVQDIASGRDPFETPHIPEETAIGLIDVRKGSAVYSCVAHAPKLAIENLKRAGAVLASESIEEIDSEQLVMMLRPIRVLSKMASSIGCTVEIFPDKGKTPPIFVVRPNDYQRIAERVLLKGKTSIVAKIVRVGGATGTKCSLRLPTVSRLLYCDVKGKDLARRLGEHLYEDILAHGDATWIHRGWRLYRFRITDFSQTEFGNVEATLKELQEAGLGAWDAIRDPESYIRELRT